MATLLINPSYSTCSACGKHTIPSATKHDELYGIEGVQGIDETGVRPAGCGEPFTHVGSEYRGGGIEEAAQAVRPDLPWDDAIYLPNYMRID